MLNKKFKKTNIRNLVIIVLITLVAVFLRSIPSFRYAIWGVDFGIYYDLTTAFVNLGQIFKTLPSIWGSSGYGDFPMFYWTMIFLHDITGISVQNLLLHFTPIFAGFTVPIIYLIAKKLTDSDLIGIFSALFLAINPLEVFETSMVGLLVFGHVFLLLSMLLFIYARDNPKYYFPLAVSSLALILSHHLTTYMYTISIIGIIYFTKMMYPDYKSYKYEVIYLIAFTSSTFFFWLTFVSSMYGFITQAFLGFIPWYTVILIFYILLLSLLFTSRYFRKYFINFLKTNKFDFKSIYYFMITIFVSISILVLLITIGINGIKISLEGMLLSLPFILTLGFVGTGIRDAKRFSKIEIILGGWTFFLTLSMIFSLITWNGVLIPYRYLEYLFEPFSIFAGIGLYSFYSSIKEYSSKFKEKEVIYFYPQIHNNYGGTIIGTENRLIAHTVVNAQNSAAGIYVKKTKGHRNLRSLFITILILTILVSIVTAYPLINQVSETSQNYVTPTMMGGIQWLEKNGNKSYSVATDAVDGLYIEALGFNTTFEYTYQLWNSTNWTNALFELEGLNGTYPEIGYVLINSNMLNNGVYGFELVSHPSYDPPILISNLSFEKFFKEPFTKVYYNSTADGSQWVYVFMVNWTYINNYESTEKV
ncbi:MAG: hypothetical protein ACP5SF_03845 [Thermoplasmata archaeon]